MSDVSTPEATKVPLVSVVVPTYKRADKIGPVLRSVLDQTLQDFEVVVVDDASLDGTDRVVQEIGDPRIRLVVHDVNRGGNAARRTGIEHSTGRYVAFLDSDDVWLPTKLERQVQALVDKGPGYGLCATWYVMESPDGTERSRVEPTLEGLAVPALYAGNWLGSYSTIMVERTALDAVGGPDPSLKSCQDWDLYLRVNQVTSLVCVREHLIRYLVDDDDPVRISGRRSSVLSGHRHVVALAAQADLDDATRVAAAVTFMQVFAHHGSARDLVRAVRLVPARAWTPRGVRFAVHMCARAARRRLSGARRPSA